MADVEPQAGRAAALMDRAERGEEWLDLPDEVLAEAVWTMESYYEVPRFEVGQKLGTVLNLAGVRTSSRTVLLQALQLYAASKADFVDCLLAARSRDQDIPIYTFDETDFKRLNVTWEKP
jgi:predicted nucleic-acid-binding protein